MPDTKQYKPIPNICSVEINEKGVPIVKMPNGEPIPARPKGSKITIEHGTELILARVTLTIYCNIKPTNHE